MQFRSDYLCSVRWEAGLAGGTLDKRGIECFKRQEGFWRQHRGGKDDTV